MSVLLIYLLTVSNFCQIMVSQSAPLKDWTLTIFEYHLLSIKM